MSILLMNLNLGKQQKILLIFPQFKIGQTSILQFNINHETNCNI